MTEQKTDFREITYPFMRIEPRNKTQQKELDRYRDYLKITEPQEDFVLKCILSFDWNRDAILYGIEKIKKSKGSLDMIDFRVRVKQPSHTVSYCVSNPLREEGWVIHSHSERCWSVWHSLNRYITSKY